MYSRPAPQLATIALVCLPLPAQQGFAEIQAQLERERIEMVRGKQGRVSLDDFRELADRHSTVLEKFLERARGTEAANARLMLTDIHLQIGNPDRAKQVLAGIDPQTTPGIELLTAAEIAQSLGMDGERKRWIQIALAKASPFEERMAMGMILMTRLVEVERGEQLFAAAYAAADDDDSRARVLWFQANATREREDVDESAYEQALKTLVKKQPKTYFGGVARDRLRAMRFAVGDPAIPIRGKDLSGKPIELAEFRGKVVLLCFWASWYPPALEALPRLASLDAKFANRDLVLLGIPLDEDLSAVRSAVAKHRFGWRQLFDGRGQQTDAALRYNIDFVPRYLLIDRQGKLASLELDFDSDAVAAEATATIGTLLSR